MRKLNLIWISALILIALSSLAYAHSYTPLHYYEMENNLTDTGTYTSTLTEFGTVSYETGIIGNMSKFDDDVGGFGRNQSAVNITAIRSLDWAFSPITSSVNDVVVSIGNGVDDTDKLRCYIDGSDKLACILTKDDSTKFNMVSSITLKDGNWYHVVITMGAQGANMTINSNHTATSTNTDTFSTDFDSIALGNSNYGTFLADVYMDNVAFFEEIYTTADIIWSFNGGALRYFSGAPAPGEGVEAPNVTLVNPDDNDNNVSFFTNFSYNVTSPPDSTLTSCQLFLNASGTWSGNISDNSPTNDSINYFNNVPLTEGSWLWNVYCVDNNSNSSFATANYTYNIDTTNPVITPNPDLLNNRTVVYNGSLFTYINFSDEREIYSINITFGNGTLLFNKTNIGKTFYQVNISKSVGTKVRDNITARLCDSSTLQSIKDIDNKVKDQGIKYVMKKKFWIFDDKWVHIYPRDYSSYKPPNNYKEKDRYVFTFNKETSPSTTETFIVESSDFIDIAKLQTKGGHLVIPSIGDNGYWVDFVNDEATGYHIERISDTKIEVTVYGLKSKSMTFHSIGELNCVSQLFYFGNLNPTETYPAEVLVGNTSIFSLSVTEDSLTVQSINATLHYNNTAYYAGNSSNFSINVTAPTSISGNTTNIPFYWSIIVNGNNYNLTSYNQNVSDFFIDNCTDYSTIALNYTTYDEGNNSIIRTDITGVYNYSFSTIKKSYTLNADNVNSTQICIFPNYATITADYYLYYEGTDYPQRRYYDNDATLNNITQDIPLYLLHTDKGIYARFRVVDPYSNPIEDVEGTMKRTIGGTLRTIEQENTDSSGLATFWVNPDQDYIFTFSKAGQGSATFSLRPTTSEIYTVTLGSTTSARNESYSTGISYTFLPTTDLQNNTQYTFNFYLTSDYWTITNCTLYLKNGSNILDSSASSYTSSICDISINYNTTNLQTIKSEVHYSLNQSNNIIVSTTYSVKYRYEGQFSLKNFLDDLKDFAGAGFNDFTRMVIAFIIIVAIIAGLAYKADITDPEVLIGLLIGLVLFFSYLGWLTLNYESIPTAWLKKYIIALIVFFGGGAYIIKRATE